MMCVMGLSVTLFTRSRMPWPLSGFLVSTRTTPFSAMYTPVFPPLPNEIEIVGNLFDLAELLGGTTPTLTALSSRWRLLRTHIRGCGGDGTRDHNHTEHIRAFHCALSMKNSIP